MWPCACRLLLNAVTLQRPFLLGPNTLFVRRSTGARRFTWGPRRRRGSVPNVRSASLAGRCQIAPWMPVSERYCRPVPGPDYSDWSVTGSCVAQWSVAAAVYLQAPSAVHGGRRGVEWPRLTRWRGRKTTNESLMILCLRCSSVHARNVASFYPHLFPHWQFAHVFSRVEWGDVCPRVSFT